MEAHEVIIRIVGLLKSKTVEELEERSKFMDEEQSKKFVEKVIELSNDETVLEKYSEELYQKAVKTGCYDDYINKKVMENTKQLVIKLLREGYRVDKICNMLELTYSDIEEIVSNNC